MVLASAIRCIITRAEILLKPKYQLQMIYKHMRSFDSLLHANIKLKQNCRKVQYIMAYHFFLYGLLFTELVIYYIHRKWYDLLIVTIIFISEMGQYITEIQFITITFELTERFVFLNETLQTILDNLEGNVSTIKWKNNMKPLNLHYVNNTLMLIDYSGKVRDFIEYFKCLKIGHSLLYETVSLIEGAYQKVILISLVVNGLNSIFTLYVIIDLMLGRRIPVLAGYVMHCFLVYFFTSGFLWLCFISDRLENESKKTRALLLELQYSSVKFDPKNEVKHIALAVLAKKVKISACGFFNVNLQTVSTVKIYPLSDFIGYQYYEMIRVYVFRFEKNLIVSVFNTCFNLSGNLITKRHKELTAFLERKTASGISESSFLNFLLAGSSSEGPSLGCLIPRPIGVLICGGSGATNPAIGGGAATETNILLFILYRLHFV